MHQIHRPLELIWSDLCREKIFHLGIIIKIVLIIALMPTIQQEWFIPFIVNWIENPTTLPWSGYMLSDGDQLAFPYGVIMFISVLPGTAIGWIIDHFFVVEYFTSIGFKLSLLGADILLLLLLLQIFENYWKKVLIYFWLSPLILFITYWHGQLDIIPVTLFIFALTLVKRRNYWAIAGTVLACSIAAKHSMVIGAPFIILYLWSHNGINKEFQRFLTFFICSLLIIEFPFFMSDAFRTMVLNNQEVGKLYWLFVDMGKDNLIFLTPLVYLLLLYFFWRIRRINFDLLLAAMGVAFSVVILMTPSPPGWYLWLVPIYTLHQSRYGFGADMVIGIFSVLFISYHLFNTVGASSALFDFSLFELTFFYSPFVKSLHYTLMVGSGLLIAIQILREGIRENDYYRLGNRPIVMGVAGNSGVGKSTFTRKLASVFGERALVEVSGDDYHNWERSSPMWKTLTHLDPKANRLFELVRDVQGLMDGKIVKARRYDHTSGRFLPKEIRKTKDVILVEGLHTLYPKQLLEELDVSFFIEMEESLRQHLSIKRDTEERGHVKEVVLSDIAKRQVDSEKYIKPQAERADIVFTFLIINMELFEKDQVIDSNIKLKIHIRNGIYYQELVKVLVGVCGLQVNIDSVDERGEVVLEISGEVVSEDIRLAVNMLVPHMDELLDFSAEFTDGLHGIMQIITLMEIDEALRRRRSK
jgi:uridine kinase